MDIQDEENPNLPIWTSYGRDSQIEDVGNDAEDQLILAYRNRNRGNIPVINLSDDPVCMAEIEENCRMFRKCLMGRLQDARYFSTDYLQTMLEKVWNVERERFHVIGQYEGTLLMTFEDQEERDSVLESGPWNVNGGLLMLAPWQDHVVMTTYQIEKAPFWVQIHGLPKDFQSPERVVSLGMVAGEVRLIDCPENSTYMRVRTIINPDKPLVAGIYLIHLESKQKHWVEFRYERLCLMCHRCGVMGHVKKDCTMSSTDINHMAQSKMKEIRAKLSQNLSATKGFSFLVKLHGGCELHIKGIALTSQRSRRSTAKHSQNANGGHNIAHKQIHSNKQHNHASSSKPKMEWRPKKTD